MVLLGNFRDGVHPEDHSLHLEGAEEKRMCNVLSLQGLPGDPAR